MPNGFRTSRTVGGRPAGSATLQRRGLGDVETAMNLPAAQDIFGGVTPAFTMDDLRRAMAPGGRRGGGGTGLGVARGGGERRAREDELRRMREESRLRMQEMKAQADIAENMRRRAERSRKQEEYGKAVQMMEGIMGGAGRAHGMRSPHERREVLSAILGVGTERAHEGMMQTGRLLASQGAGGVATGPDPEPAASPYGFGGNPNPAALPFSPEASMALARQQYQQQLTPQQVAAMQTGAGFRGAPGTVMGSREEGGGIPETGLYQLHEGEQVIPAPEKLQEMVMDYVIDRQMGDQVGTRTKKKRKGKKGKAKDSYQEGTPEAMTALQQMLEIYQPHEQPFGPELTTTGGVPWSQIGIRPSETGMTQEGPMSGEEILTREALATLPDAPGMPSPMDDPETRPRGLPGEEGGPGASEMERRHRASMETRQMVADPSVHPQQALDRTAAERERMQGSDEREGKDATYGAEQGYEGTVTESRGEAGERKFTLEGSPYGMSERMEDRFDTETRQIEEMNDAARSHARYASQLLHYANQRPHSMAYEKIREMAADRLKMGQEIERAASMRQKQLDAMVATTGEQEARMAGAEIEAAGRVGAARETGAARVAAAERGGAQRQQQEAMERMAEVFRAYAGSEGVDEETMMANMQQLMQLFAMMGGFQEVMGGGLPNQ